MTDQAPPCTQGLDEDCFKAMPVWAKQAFAYRLLMLITPKQLTRRLSRRLFRLILPPDVVLAPGADLPPGTIVPPGTTVPIGWTTGDPLPTGTIPPGSLPPGTDQTGTTPPLYVPPFTPGPVKTAPPGSPGGVAYYIYDTFDALDPALWNDASQGSGSISFPAGRLKCLAPGGGDVAGVNWMTTDPDMPATFEWGFDMNHQAGTGQILLSLRTGTHWIYLIFEPPTTLKYLKLGCVPSSRTIDTITGATDSWRLVYNGTTISLYRGTTILMNGVSVCANTSLKGTRFVTLSDGNTTYFDNYYMLPT